MKWNGQTCYVSTQAYLGSKSTTISTTLYISQKKQRVCAKFFFCPNFLSLFLRRFGQKVECWVCRNEWASHFKVTCFWSFNRKLRIKENKNCFLQFLTFTVVKKRMIFSNLRGLLRIYELYSGDIINQLNEVLFL